MVSKKVAEQIRYLEAKTRYERILREQRTLNEYSDGGEFFFCNWRSIWRYF